MSSLEKIIFDKLKKLVLKMDTRNCDLTIKEYSKIFNDPDIFIRQTTKEILLEISKEDT